MICDEAARDKRFPPNRSAVARAARNNGFPIPHHLIVL
jgi:hypothetical protein